MTARNLAASSAGYVPPPPTDPKLNYVSLLLNGDGTNGGQNSTFLDSSSNNLTLTPYGNPKQGPASVFGSTTKGCIYFTGTGSKITAPNNAAFQLDLLPFTVEFWVYITALTGSNPQLFSTYTTNGRNAVTITLGNADRKIYVSRNVNYLISTTAIPLNTWTHIAVTFTDPNSNLFINGVLESSSTAAIYTKSNNACTIGNGLAGYISNFRLVKGTNLYGSTNFTPSTSLLTDISGTSILTCQNGGFKDNSSNNFTITPTSVYPIVRTSNVDGAPAYDVTVESGMSYFDSNDYIAVTYNSALDLGSSDFTFETWINPTGYSQPPQYQNTGGGAMYSKNDFSIWMSDGWAIVVRINGTDVLGTAWYTITSYTWAHIAVVRSGSTLTIYVNGVNKASTTFTGTINATTDRGVIGRNDQFGGSFHWVGYLSNLRLVKGTALYTSNFTVPTSSLTNITNTVLLAKFENFKIADLVGKNMLETLGNAQLSTSVKKYGTASIAFDGNGDGLYSPKPSVPQLDFKTADFTIEFWILFNNVSSFQTIISNGYTPLLTSGTGWVVISVNGSMQFWEVTPSTTVQNLSDNGAMVANQWYHIAIVRSGTSLKLYRDGVQVASTTTSTDFTPVWSSATYIGGGGTSGFDSNYLNGYLDDLRVTTGLARYTANFTPPTEALPTM